MYRLMALISLIIRQYYIPNPFEALGEGVFVNIEGASILLSPDRLNRIAELFMHGLTFTIVGLYYESGFNHPVLGSFLYLLLYCVHTFLLWIMSLAGFSTWAVILIVILYVGCHVGLINLRNNYY